MNADGWPVVTPYRYTGETTGKVRREDVAGEYKYINHGKAITAAITAAQYIRLEQNGAVSGAAQGSWKRTGHNRAELTLGGVRYEGVFLRQWNPESAGYALTFSALSRQGVAVWGSRLADKSDREVVADVQRDLILGDTSGVIANLSLPAEGARQSRIVWSSSNGAVVSEGGVVTRPAAGAGNASVTLTATITKGAASATKTFAITVKEQTTGGLVARYPFDGNLADNSGQQGAGAVTGDRIDRAGGTIGYAAGVRGDAAVFDGASGVRLPDGLIAGRRYSVALWLKPDQLTEFTTAFFGARDPNNWVSLVPKGHGFVNNQTMVWSGTAWYDAGTGLQIAPGQWSHLAFTVQDGALTVYVNGAQRFSGANFPDVFTTTNGTFGLGVNWWDLPYKGLADDLHVYDRALSAAEVAALAQPAP